MFIFLLCSVTPAIAEPETCTYQTYKWNIFKKQAVEQQTVALPYARLLAHQVDMQTGCSVCEEDQELIRLTSVPPFKVCRHLSQQIKTTLQDLIDSGVTVHAVIGYRVGMTRGDADEKGNRTRFSNHSFGIALDINPQQNGLYDNCLKFGPQCRLLRGGNWIPGRPGTLMHDGPVVNALKQIGFHWGGEIQGRQKDFMHFSPSGY